MEEDNFLWPGVQQIVARSKQPPKSLHDIIESTKNTSWYDSYLKCKKQYKRGDTYPDITKIDYSFNSLGGRGPEINVKNNTALYMGCSMTEGVGLKLEHTWSYMLHRKAWPVLQYLNMGMGGGDITRCYDVLTWLLEEQGLKNIKKLVLLAPPYHRQTLFLEDNTMASEVISPAWSPAWFKNHENSRVNTWLNLYTDVGAYKVFIQSLTGMYALCKAHNIDFTWSYWCPDNHKLVLGQLPDYLRACLATNGHLDKTYDPGKNQKFDYVIAGDYMHPGPNWQWTMSEDLLLTIREK